MIDTHIHINVEQYQDDWRSVIQRALDAGVSKMIIPNVDYKGMDETWHIQSAFPEVIFPMIGIHPCSVTKDWATQMAWVREEAQKNSYCAIGEIGIDLYWDKSLKKEQELAFIYQVELAMELGWAINIHSRESIDLCIDLLKDVQTDRLRGIFHCFTGTLSQAKNIIDLGMHMGIGGVITFKNSTLREVVAQVDISHLVLETDGPYLTPHPHRGKRNESRYLTLIVDEIAKAHQTTPERVIEITTCNSRAIYNLI